MIITLFIMACGLDGKQCFSPLQPYQPSCPRLCEKDQPVDTELASGKLVDAMQL